MCTQMDISHKIVFFFQVVMVTGYWTKFNLAAVFISLGFFFLCTRITQSPFFFQRSASDYPFIGTLLLIPLSLESCCFWLWRMQRWFFFSMSTRFKIQNKLISEQLLTKHAVCILNMMKCVLSAIWCLVNRFGSSLCFYHQVCLTMPSPIQWCGSQLCSLPWLLFYHLWLHALLMSPSRSMTSTRWDIHIMYGKVLKYEYTYTSISVLLGQLHVLSLAGRCPHHSSHTIENLECWHVWLDFYHFFKLSL